MDAFDRIGDHGLDAQIHRADSGMFAGRTLPVAVASDDDAVPSGVTHRGSSLGKGRLAFFIEPLKHDFRVFGDIAAVFQVDSGGHDVVGAGLVAGADHHGSFDGFGHGLIDRRTADRLLADDFDIFAAARRRDQHGIVDQEFFRILHLRISKTERRRIGDLPGQGSRCGHFRTDQIVLVSLGAGASGEIAVESAERDRVVGGTLSLPDARAAAGFQNTGSG